MTLTLMMIISISLGLIFGFIFGYTKGYDDGKYVTEFWMKEDKHDEISGSRRHEIHVG